LVIIFSSNVFAASKNNSNSRIGIDLGIAFDLDLGITAQYKAYSFFINDDALAIDVRVQNFYNDRKTLHFYIDVGGFVENYNGNDATRDDSVGVRAPVGFTLGIERNLEAYIQAVPFYDFNNNEGFGVDGALGVRYRF